MKVTRIAISSVSAIVLIAGVSLRIAYAENHVVNAGPDQDDTVQLVKKKTKKKKKKKKKGSKKARPNDSAQNQGSHLGGRAEKVAMEVGATPDKITTTASSTTMLGADEKNVSQATAGSGLYGTLKKKVELSYFGVYHGGAVNDPGNALQPTIAGNPDPTSPQNLETFVTVGYKPTKDWVIGVVPHFFYNSGSMSAANGPGNQSVTGNLEMLNPLFMVSKAKLIDLGNFTVKGYLYGMVPMSKYDSISMPGHNQWTRIQPTANISWDIPHSRWNLSMYTYIRQYINGSNTPDGLATYQVYAGPNVSYQATKTLAATLWVDALQGTRTQGTAFFSGMANAESDIEPGVAWDIIPGNLTINPIVNIYPVNPTLASTSFEAVLIGRAW